MSVSSDGWIKSLEGAIADVVKERGHQIFAEGFDVTHDDKQTLGQMAAAAACYAAPFDMSRYWPWGDEWDKKDKHPRRRQLVIAAALIVAEIERLDRAEAATND
jgi:hypothetical protein